MVKKYIKINLILVSFLVLLVVIPSKAMANTEHGLELKAVVCD